MTLVRESISFQRNPSAEGIKTALFGFRVGQIVAKKNISGVLRSIYVIERFEEGGDGESKLVLYGLGYIYDFPASFSGEDLSSAGVPERAYFEFCGTSTSMGDPEIYRALTDKEKDLLKIGFNKWPETAKNKIRDFKMASDKDILLEDFKRGLTRSEIKDKLIGFRPGQLITYDKPWGKKPYKEVYMFIERGADLDGEGIPITTCYIGALSQRDGKLSQFLARNKKVFGITPLWAEEKRGLTPEELEKVRKTFNELPNYYKKIVEETGLTPSINEALEFKRGVSSDREMKEKLFGWRIGQILVAPATENKGHFRLFVFGGYTDKNLNGDLRIRCLEIGHISGKPLLGYIHFGFFQDMLAKREQDLHIPNSEQAEAIQKALRKTDYRKYVEKSEEKIGAKIFV